MLHIYHIDMTLYVHYFSLSNDIYFYINVLFFFNELLFLFFFLTRTHMDARTHARIYI